MSKAKRKAMKTKKRNIPYSVGEVNQIIDSLLHPWFRDYPWLRLVDGLLHALNEQDPPRSLEKFIRYHAPELLEELARWMRTQLK